jgi:hypothetical protein
MSLRANANINDNRAASSLASLSALCERCFYQNTGIAHMIT